MKLILIILAGICALCAALATPAAIIFGIYEWAAADVAFKVALWSAAKVWLSMLAMIIPGGILYLLA